MSDRNYTPPTVRRIETDTGSHVEPPIDQAWSELEQLRWKAAVTEVDGGVPVRVWEMGRGRYSVQVGRSSLGAAGFDQCWSHMSSASCGAEQRARVDAWRVETVPFREEDLADLAGHMAEAGLPHDLGTVRLLVDCIGLEVEIDRYGLRNPTPGTEHYTASRWVTAQSKDQ